MGAHFDALLVTPEVRRFVDTVVAWMKADIPGGCTLGRQRLGKSLACELLKFLLPKELGRAAAVLIFTIPTRKKWSERAFFSELLQQLNFEFALSRDTSRLETNLLDLLDQACEHAQASDLVIVIDEAQNLDELGYQQLVHLHNLLVRRKRRVFTLVNGQLELEGLRKAFLASNKLEIIGRFFSRCWQFFGLSLDDLAAVMTALDEPTTEGGCVTRRLAPKAFEKGWRLAPAAPRLALAVRQIAARSKVIGDPMIPMQNLVSLVLILARKAEAADEVTIISTEELVDGLTESGYFDVMALHAKPA